MEAVVSSREKELSAPSARELATPRAAGPDLLRAMAIVLVMLWHLPRPARLASLQGLREYSWTGVDLFFVLSGYLIGTQLLAPLARGQLPRLREFYLKRSFRILPAFLVVLALCVFVPALSGGSHMQPAWRFLTFTMNFGLDFRATGGFTQAWSLCVEEHFYLLLPLLVLILSRVRWRGWVFLLIGGVLFGGSLYLSHKMTNHAAQLLFDPQDLAGASGLAIYYGSSIVVAAALWAMVERPFLLLRERLLRR